MAQGWLQARRTLLISQSALIWGSADSDSLTTFIETGYLETRDASEEPALPYDQEALRLIVEQQGGGGDGGTG